MIAVFILKKLNSKKELHTKVRKSIYDILEEKERAELYGRTKKIIKENKIKVVFNILEGSLLITQVEAIRQYLNDYEVTTPFIKSEYSSWSGKVTFKDFSK